MPVNSFAKSTGVIAHIDGASRDNPGPAAYAVVMKEASGAPVACFNKCIGRATNNVAEYQALLAALRYALENHLARLRVISDSELLVRQIQGTYKVRNADLKPLHEEAQRMIARLESFSIAHVPRERNREADRLANQALESAAKGASFEPDPTISQHSQIGLLRTPATYRKGVLKPQHELSLAEGEEVDLEIRRKKSAQH